MARLIGRTGAVADRDFVLDDNMRLGAAKENDVRITAEGVSRRHARIFREAGKFWVEDTGATNGTFLNGSRVQREMLRHLDVITLGRKVDLIFLSPENEPPPAPEADQLIDVKLEILDGAEAGTVVDIPRGEVTIGRAPSCNVVLFSPAVGRAHARIERNAKRLLLQDLRSANGTFVNGKPIDGTALLASGDVIGLGGVRSVTVRIQGTPSPMPGLGDLPPDAADPISQEWKTRFMWGPEELAQMEAARVEAIARASLREPAVPAKAAQAAPKGAAIAPPAAAVSRPAPAAPAPPKAEPRSAKPEIVVEPVVAASKPSPPASGAPPPEMPAAPSPALPVAPRVARSAAPAAAPAVAKPVASPPPPRVDTPTSAVTGLSAEPAIGPEGTTIGALAKAGQLQGISLVGSCGPLRLGLGTFKVGRAADAEVRLDDRQVSRAHASIVVDLISATIEDLKTINGTLVNGHEIKRRATLKSGDTVRIGESEFKVELITNA
jgi:pSer/pThr/pTyr-binding forkhead associated (FHA) protein